MNRIISTLIIASLLCGPASADTERNALPDMGSSAQAAIGPDEERRMGESLLYEYRRAELVLEDPVLNEYLSSLAYRLVAQSERPDQAFEFFWVRQESVNAFAAPGGFIGVHTGLITTAETESELAAVLAHEIAHVTQHHLIRTVEDMKKVSLPIALAMIGAVIAASQSDSANNDAAPAALMAGMGLMQQNLLNFTREHEYEADRVGIKTLASAQFEPMAMATFFGRMDRVTRANGDRPPEFLSTHPVSAARISEAKTRATAGTPTESKALELESSTAQFPGLGAWRPGAPTKANAAEQNARFLRMRERARVLASTQPDKLIGFYRQQIEKGKATDRDAWRYGLALALAHNGKTQEAIEWLRDLRQRQPHNRDYLLALADVKVRARSIDQARALLAPLHQSYPDQRPIALGYANALLASQTKADAQRALGILRPLLTQDGWDVALQRSFARAAELAGDTSRALEAHAEVALYSGNAEDALKQLQTLLKNPDIGYYQRARVENRIAEIMPLVLELRRRFGDANVGDREEES